MAAEDFHSSDVEVDAHEHLMFERTGRVCRSAELGVVAEFVQPVFVTDERIDEFRPAPEGTDIERQAVPGEELRLGMIAEAVETLRYARQRLSVQLESKLRSATLVLAAAALGVWMAGVRGAAGVFEAVAAAASSATHR